MMWRGGRSPGWRGPGARLAVAARHAGRVARSRGRGEDIVVSNPSSPPRTASAGRPRNAAPLRSLGTLTIGHDFVDGAQQHALLQLSERAYICVFAELRADVQAKYVAWGRNLTAADG
eukprot:197553-Chlamydomonas_euryale.AAC.2